jgi:hypothetical protein
MPTIRSRGQEREPAGDDEHFPVLQYLTAGGRQEWANATTRYKRELITELDRRARPKLDRGGRPELTAEDVAAAMTAVEQRLHLTATAPAQRPPRASIWAAITLTVASIGIGVMPNFLDGEPWRSVLFALFIVVGIISLVLTWVAGTAEHRRAARDRRRTPPDPIEHDS